jgi:hypothetical protein
LARNFLIASTAVPCFPRAAFARQACRKLAAVLIASVSISHLATSGRRIDSDRDDETPLREGTWPKKLLECENGRLSRPGLPGDPGMRFGTRASCICEPPRVGYGASGAAPSASCTLYRNPRTSSRRRATGGSRDTQSRHTHGVPTMVLRCVLVNVAPVFSVLNEPAPTAFVKFCVIPVS